VKRNGDANAKKTMFAVDEKMLEGVVAAGMLVGRTIC